MKITELNDNLFSIDNNLAHCVSADFRMGKGIAIEFKKRFNNVNYLKSLNKKVGDVAYIKKGNKFIFYLITKEKYYLKPTYSSLRNSLIKLKEELIKLKISNISIPKIGCGLDGLDWNIVKSIITDIFENMYIDILVFYI